jgi:hypothetical protein
MISTKNKRRGISVFLVLAVLILYALKNSSYFIRLASSVGALLAVYAIDNLFKLDLKVHHYLMICGMILSGFLLSNFYYIYPNYDKILHFVQPALLFFIIFYLVSKLDLPYKWELTFTFFIVVALLGLFETGEYALDRLFDLKLQGVFLRGVQGLEKYNIILDRNADTMIDLSLGTLSAGLCAIGCALWVVFNFGKEYLHIDSRFHALAKKVEKKLAK